MRARWDWSLWIPLGVAGALLGVLALGRVAIGLQAIAEAQQLDYGEPIVYAQATRFLNGELLYQHLDTPPFTVAAYTPLYYKLASELQARVGPAFGPGRALSFAAGLVTSVELAWLAARYTRLTWAGPFAALLFLGLGFPGTVPWFAVYRVDMLAEALALGAIVVLAHGTGVKHVLVAALLAGLALHCGIRSRWPEVSAQARSSCWCWHCQLKVLQPMRQTASGGGRPQSCERYRSACARADSARAATCTHPRLGNASQGLLKPMSLKAATPSAVAV